MDWLLLAGLGIIWAAFLILPKGPNHSVEGFEKEMDLLSHLYRRPGRWVMMPRRDERFLGGRGRARARARERRRRVLTVLLEAIGLTALIGAFPPLRAMWWATAFLAGLLGTYVYLLFQVRAATAMAVAGPSLASVEGSGHVVPVGQGPLVASSPPVAPARSAGDAALDDEALADAGIRLLAR